MDTQVGTPVKIFALLALVLALGLGGMTMLKSGSSDTVSSPVTPVVHRTPTRTPAPARTATPAPARTKSPATTHRPARTAPKTHATQPAAKPTTKAPAPTRPAQPAPTPPAQPAPTPPAKPAPTPTAVATNGLPVALDELLHIHRVVVVAVYDSEISTDLLFLAEAKAGARDAHVGFLAVNVLNEKLAAPLTAAAGKGALLPSPGLLVYKQPAALMNVLTGFLDRAAVANAAANALVADTPAVAASSATGTAATGTAVVPATTTP